MSESLLSILWGTHLEEDSWFISNSMISFSGNAKQFSTAAESFYKTNNVPAHQQFLHIVKTLVLFWFIIIVIIIIIIAILVDMKWYLTVVHPTVFFIYHLVIQAAIFLYCFI